MENEKQDGKQNEKQTAYWPYRPGFNWLLGYTEGKPVSGEGIREVCFDRTVKNGKKLSK